jgi:hypothetical protein
MMFRSPQPESLQNELELIQSSLGTVDPDDLAELKQLEQVSRDLEASIGRMKGTEQKMKQVLTVEFRIEHPGDEIWFGPEGMVPTTHTTIHNHSRPTPHPTWVWISTTSTVDGHRRLGFPATEAESHRFGARARKVFLRQPHSNLHC